MTRYGRVVFHGGLVLVPILIPESMKQVINQDSQPKVLDALREARWALQQWFGERYQFELMSCLMGYDYLCNWDPVVMFRMLQCLVEHRQNDHKLLPAVQDIQMPAGAPTLAFMVGAAKRVGQWPVLPQASYGRDSVIKNRMGGMLDMAGAETTIHGVQVLQPAFACDAILKGVLAWISSIHDIEPIEFWDIQPLSNDSSMLLLVTEGNDQPYKLPIRQYQLGSIGLKTVFERLDELSQGYLELSAPWKQ